MHNARRVTAIHELPDGEYSLELDLGGEIAIAMVELLSRADSSDPFRDPEVHVVSCTDASAREWLEDEENERCVWKVCTYGVRGAA